MKLFLSILIYVLFASSVVWFAIKLKSYINIYNDFVDGIKAKKAYKTNDNVLLKSHFKKAIIYYCIASSCIFLVCLGLLLAYTFGFISEDNFLVEILPLSLASVSDIIIMRMYIIAKSHTHIILGQRIFKISDIESVTYDRKKAYKRFSLKLKSGKVKKFNLYLDELAYDFILKTIEENAEVKI